jgi:uncharacterized protein (DUF1800 family)
MNATLTRIAATSGVLLMVAGMLPASAPSAASSQKAGASPADAPLDVRQRALHALNRLAFGPRPGDADRLLQQGVDAWIEQQLHPERIDDRAVESRLVQYVTLRMNDREIWDRYYAPILDARKSAKAMAVDGEAQPDRKEMMAKARRELPRDQRPNVVMEDLVAQRILRAAESDRQLNEVMVDFWMNHFNVYAGKGIDRFMLTSYERDAIRPHIWGRFEDLLRATAKSPAMLFYLDNARSSAALDHRPERAQRFAERRGRRRERMADEMSAAKKVAPKANRGGLNENYAREIMELHTLGVDGGYSQKDVTELARVFTGWTIQKPENGGGFIFRAGMHDVQEKNVLGVHFAAGGGQEEGERMIALLAHHPATAHHIAYQLCQRLVADEPPPALVARVAKRFLTSGGDLRETVRAVTTSAEFWSPRAYRAKVKTPFEYVVSAMRAAGTRIDDPTPIARALNQIGEGLYQAQPPTGYSDRADTWMNSGALLNRLNFSLALAANKMKGVRTDVSTLISADATRDPGESVDALARALTGGTLTDATRATISARLTKSDPPAAANDRAQLGTAAGLILGSPEFQRQ